MKNFTVFVVLILFYSVSSFSQNIGINATGATPNNNAILDIASDDKGILITRLTTVARTTLGTALGVADNGMLVYDKDLFVFYFWDGTQWVLVGNGAGSDDQNLTGATLTGTSLQIDIENGTSTTADLSGLIDHDWYEEGTTSPADNINDNIFTQGNVGIGINTPNSKLDVNGDILYSGNASSQFQITSVSDNILLNMIKTSTSSVNAQILFDGYGAPIDQGQIRFFTRWDPSTGGAGSLDHVMSIMETGNVGIGTTNPSEKLVVNGSIKITDGTQGNGKILTSDATGKATWEYGGVPAGAVMAFNLATCPTGWAVADGTGSTPDLRGEFIRGLDNGRGVDAARLLSSWQKGSLNFIEDGNQGGGMSSAYSTNNNSSSSVSISIQNDSGYDNVAFADYPLRPFYVLPITQPGLDRPLAVATSDTEWFDYTAHPYHSSNSYWGVSRPRNVALLYCIKQ